MHDYCKNSTHSGNFNSALTLTKDTILQQPDHSCFAFPPEWTLDYCLKRLTQLIGKPARQYIAETHRKEDDYDSEDEIVAVPYNTYDSLSSLTICTSLSEICQMTRFITRTSLRFNTVSISRTTYIATLTILYRSQLKPSSLHIARTLKRSTCSRVLRLCVATQTTTGYAVWYLISLLTRPVRKLIGSSTASSCQRVMLSGAKITTCRS